MKIYKIFMIFLARQYIYLKNEQSLKTKSNKKKHKWLGTNHYFSKVHFRDYLFWEKYKVSPYGCTTYLQLIPSGFTLCWKLKYTKFFLTAVLKSIPGAADRYTSSYCRCYPLCLHILLQDLGATCSLLAFLVFSSTDLLLPE